MATPTHTVSIRYRELVDGVLKGRGEKIFTGKNVAAPASVHLEPGEIRVVPIGSRTMGDVRAGALVVTTTPGIRARLSKGIPHKFFTPGRDTLNSVTVPIRGVDMPDSGYVLTGLETTKSQVQDGATTPVFDGGAGGNWINHESGSNASYSALQKSARTGQQYYYGDYCWISGNFGSSVTKRIVCFCWGRDEYINLGTDDDGKVFQWWMDTPTTANLTSIKFQIGTLPFVSNVHDSDAYQFGTGDEYDLTMVANTPPSPYWEVDLTAQAVHKRWALFRAEKSDFSATGLPRWDRTTWLRIEYLYSVSPNDSELEFRGTPIYFGDPVDGYVNSVAFFHRQYADPQNVFLELYGHPTKAADVTVIGMISYAAAEGA